MYKANNSKWFKKIAQAGLLAKGIVYILLGIVGFMAAFEVGSQTNNASSKGIFTMLQNLPLGIPLLVIVALGLICYTVWRLIQAWTLSESDQKKKWAKKIRYFFSALAYGSLAYTAFSIIFHLKSDDSDQKQKMASELLQKSNGQWLAGAVALLFAGVGVYQIYYGFTEKFKKHVQNLNLHANGSSLLVQSAKIGYIARGVVWLIIAYLFIRAALNANSSEAGDTGKAFKFIESSSYGSYLLGALGIGLITYGIFNFIRARYERFE